MENAKSAARTAGMSSSSDRARRTRVRRVPLRSGTAHAGAGGALVAGGNSQVFRRTVHGSDYEFDVGIHYIGECGPRRARSRAS